MRAKSHEFTLADNFFLDVSNLVSGPFSVRLCSQCLWKKTPKRGSERPEKKYSAGVDEFLAEELSNL